MLSIVLSALGKIVSLTTVIILNMTSWTTTVYALLPHPSRPLVLAQNGQGERDLPSLVLNEVVGPWDTYRLKPMLEEKLGEPLNILLCVARQWDEESGQLYSVQLLEPRSEILSPEAVWQPLETILQNMVMPAVLREGLQRWQGEETSGIIPERRAPWALPGWYSQAENWIVEQVSQLERGTVKAIKPVKSWSISCVLKVITEQGLLYFKVARDLPLFVNEGLVLTGLASLYPGRVPSPISVHPEHGWMLLDDFGDPPGRDLPLAEQARLMQDFARLQIGSSERIQSLLAWGCKDRRLEVLLSQIEPLLHDEIVLGPLNSEEREKLRQVGPRLRELIAELFSLPIPYALLHGDLHTGNIIPHQDAFLYFDWTDAAVSHPFFDMIRIFGEEDEAKKHTLQEAYLSAWEMYYSKTDVRRAWELASALYGFYHAVSYQFVAHGIEELVRSELNFAYYFLRKLLAGLDQLEK